ncbi:Fanconi anemia group A protein isoform X1 [Anguilla anguilla]|uniref:Fanconi anemia group A protein isoform X1 n=1 Tax=Anguilla anguilla TaxID=7936 RepID=UPI0015AC6078|nr:Fanconi anemia group A protein isoform X1 [Anguilla anguilla]
MSLGASSVSLSAKKGTFSALLAAHVRKRPACGSERELQEAAIQLLNRNQNLPELLQEQVDATPCKVSCLAEEGLRGLLDKDATPGTEGLCTLGGSLLVCALQRESVRLGVPVGVLSARLMADKVRRISGSSEGVLLNSAQRAELAVLVKSTQELRSLGAFSPQLFCQELWSVQTLPPLEVAWSLHSGNVLSLGTILDSEEGAGPWLEPELRALCGPMAAEDEDMRREVLTGVASVLIRAGFQETQDPGTTGRRLTQVCRRALDNMLSWVLDSVSQSQPVQSQLQVAESWVQVFDVSVCSVSVCSDVFLRFLIHSLTHTLTYKPRLKVSDAIAMQSAWSFAKTSRLLTLLYRKLSVLSSVDELLSHLLQVLETHEVNWQHVLSHLSTLLVYHPDAQHSLTEMLSRLLRSAFEGYDLESMITAFLLARQGALESPAIFPPYSQWFKMSFGNASGYHGNSKKSLVFLLKFLSDLVPFDPPQYLKVHLLHPPFVPAKHRILLLEYVSLAKTRLADLRVSVEEMGLYEDVSTATAPVQPQCQALQDVERAVSIFESTGKISAAVMEASIFRKPYFLSRFLPALLTPRVLPEMADARMAFIESLRKAEKIPPSLYSAYTQSCERERQRQLEGAGVEMRDQEPQERLQCELQELRSVLSSPGREQDFLAHLSRVSEALGAVVPETEDRSPGQPAVLLCLDAPPQSDQENRVVDVMVRSFCQCLMDASRVNPPNRQGPWASQFVRMLLEHRQLLPALLHRLWDLLHNQGASLGGAHVLGLAAFVVHLHAFQSQCPVVESSPALLPRPLPLPEALSTALRCSTQADMSFCLRFCVAAVCYGLSRGDSTERVQQYVPSSLYRKLLYLIPRLVPGTRVGPGPVGEGLGPEWEGPGPMGMEREEPVLWRNITDPSASWRSSASVLWAHPSFHALRTLPHYQLSFSEWLAAELRVQRSQDALSDPERQEYQQWMCQQEYLSAPLDQGGCGGDVRVACGHILSAVLELETGAQMGQRPQCGRRGADTCLPDVLCRLQELLYELELAAVPAGAGGEGGRFLLDLIWEKCSVPGHVPTASTDLSTVLSTDLALQQALHACNRVMVALPVTALVTVRTQGGRTTLDCSTFMEHVNHRQRNVCTPAGLLPYPLTAHFCRGVLTASMRCDRPSRVVNEALSQMHQQCPLLLVSAVRWWAWLGPVLVSLWRRLSEDPLPEELLRLADCYTWACSAVRAESRPRPSAPPLLLAASLHCAGGRSLSTALEQLGQQRQQVLVFLLFFFITDLLSALLEPQEKSVEKARGLCLEILTHLQDCTDWLPLFQPPGAEQGSYQAVTMATTDRHARLMPLGFYSLIPHLDGEVSGRFARAPGFLLCALRCYSALSALFLDGRAPVPRADPTPAQADPLEIVARARRALFRIIALSPTPCVSHGLRRQLQEACGDLDPEVSAALSSHLAPPSPDHALRELDFL